MGNERTTLVEMDATQTLQLLNDVADAIGAALEKRALVQQLRRLEEREEEVLRARFGIDNHPMTLSEIGEKLGITRERVRQIESRALGKLRHPSVSRVWHEGQRSADAV